MVDTDSSCNSGINLIVVFLNEFKIDLEGMEEENGRILDIDRKGEWGAGSWKLDNFHRFHMRIIPKKKSHSLKTFRDLTSRYIFAVIQVQIPKKSNFASISEQ